MTLAEATRRVPVIVRRVGGERAFRRRLMELGLVPGTEVVIEKVAPLGDPLELSLRGCRLSIRRAEASAVDVEPIRARGDAADDLALAAE
ncbi:MAG: ferrous iron transport protein A [Polyangiaceae bacterium]|nr:ferrous iron transport protein A [Polyangiaceae bacterium]